MSLNTGPDPRPASTRTEEAAEARRHYGQRMQDLWTEGNGHTSIEIIGAIEILGRAQRAETYDPVPRS